MIYLRNVLIVFISLLFSSCNNIAENISWTGLVILFAVLMGLFVLMFFLISKRKKKADSSLVQFSASIQTMLNKFDQTENKIGALKVLIGRIKDDEKYKKDPTWQNQVLAKTYLHLATQYHTIGDMEKTLDTCSKILEVAPDDAMTLYNRGSIYSNNGDYDKALEDLSKSIELVDDYASSYNNRGMILSKLAKYDEALKDYSKALELEESATTYYNRGNTFKDTGEIDKALSDYKKALFLCGEYDENLRKEILAATDSLSS